MSGGKRSAGYTIVEVLIVLAISGFMFVIAANFISGKQGKTAFTQGVNEMASRIQGVVEEVTDGQFSDAQQNCHFDGTHTNIDSAANLEGQGGQGANPTCVFLGKLVHFKGSGPVDTYEVLSLAGGRFKSGDPITNLSDAKPTVAKTLTIDQKIPQSLNVNSVKINNSALQSYTFGFIQGLGTSNGSGGLESGAQDITLYYVVSATAATDYSTGPELPAANLTTASAVTVCLTDGERYAQILIGGAGNSPLNVAVKMLGSTAC